MFRVRCYSSKSLLCLSKNVNFQCGCLVTNWQGGRQSKKETFYDELGVSMDASEQDIKKAYLELCKKYHPDSDVKDKSLHDKFVKINAAYDVLCKPSERKLYDQALKAGFNPQPGEVNTAETWNPNHPQYYYHPRFYADPKMREAAAKVWEADTGWSFGEYYEDKDAHTHKVTSKDKVLGISISACLMIFGCLLGLRVYYNTKQMVALQKEKSPESFIQPNEDGTGRSVYRRSNSQSLKTNTKSEFDEIELKDPYLPK